jgi:3-oxoacyl-[acyl-carrier-protein] synthase-3
MKQQVYTKIVGTGAYLPTKVVTNDFFSDYTFFDPATKAPFDKSNDEIIQKFYEITNIGERRWASDDIVTSDMAAAAVKDACESSGIDPETLDFIILGHNFGDVAVGSSRVDTLPGMANRVKTKLHIKNPHCIVHDVISGCPGWTQAMIIADAYIKSRMFKRGVVIGADILSRISDPHDRDSMIYADGAAATILEAVESAEPTGILSHASRSDVGATTGYLAFGPSFNPEADQSELYIKMAGHKVYVYALSHVPALVKQSIDEAGLHLSDIKKVLIHQANEKMDEAILKGVFKLYGETEIPEGIMPMSIRFLGNSSTATVPTLLDLVLKGKMEGQQINPGDCVVLASVGAGMNINSIVYKF